MTTEPLPVRPVEFEYYQDMDVAVIRVMRFVAVVAIIYGTLNFLLASVQLAGIATGSGWFRTGGTWFMLLGFVTTIVSIVLVLSGIGCLSFRPLARTGMIVYAVTAIAVQCAGTVAYIVPVLRSGGRAPMGMSSALETTMLLTGYLVWLAQGLVLPAILLKVFRVREVRRAFER